MSIGQKLELSSIFLFSVFLPLHPKVIFYFLLAFILFNVYNGIKYGFSKLSAQQIPLALLFFLYVFGLLFTENMDFGLKEIESRASFLILPLFFAISTIDYKKYFYLIIWGLVLGCIISSGICEYYALKCYASDGARYCFEASRLAHYIHPTYLSLFYITAGTFLVIHAFKESNKWWYKILALMIGVYLFYFVYGFYSIGPWISFFCMLLSLLFAYFYFKKRLIYFGIAFIVVSLIAILMVSKFDLLTSDYNAISKELKMYFDNPTEYIEENQNNPASTKARIILWNSSVDFILDHPFGVGTGDVKDELVDMYNSRGMYVFAEKKLNPHNQYLQTAISIGILGMLVLIALFFFHLKKAYQSRNFYLIALLSLFFVAFLFESVLERQNGILLFVFFLSILTSQRELKSEKRIENHV